MSDYPFYPNIGKLQNVVTQSCFAYLHLCIIKDQQNPSDKYSAALKQLTNTEARGLSDEWLDAMQRNDIKKLDTLSGCHWYWFLEGKRNSVRMFRKNAVQFFHL
jgi:hypothetical protein